MQALRWPALHGAGGCGKKHLLRAVVRPSKAGPGGLCDVLSKRAEGESEFGTVTRKTAKIELCVTRQVFELAKH
jgi:hypothetical protein